MMRVRWLLCAAGGVVLLAIAAFWFFHQPEGIWFTEIASSAGLDLEPDYRVQGEYRVIETMGSGVALIDYDGDGWLDIVVGQGGELPGDSGPGKSSCRLYRNHRDGTFQDVTEAAGLHFAPFAQGMAVGDFDGDGHDDLFVAGFERSALFRNTGREGFEDVTETAGVAGSGWASSCAFADLNGNGYPDLIVTRYLADTIDQSGRPTIRCPTNQPRTPSPYGYCPPHAHDPEPDLLYRNNGDGTFTDISESAGLSDAAAPGLGVLVADLDGNGLLDLYVANDMERNQWWRNQGEFQFQESAEVAGVAVGETGESRAGMGIAAGDYDGDGLLDLLVTNFQDEPNDLYRQVSRGVFAVATDEARLRFPSMAVLGFGTGFIDADNSGDLDLFVSNGHINDFRSIGKPFKQPPQLFRNSGAGMFTDVSSGCGRYFQGSWLGRSVAFGDVNNDGAVDIVITHLDRPLALLRNDTRPRGHFLGLQLESTSASRSPVGSSVTLQWGNRTITRTVCSGGSYMAHNDPRVLVGLGDASEVDRIEIRWPDGTPQILPGLPVDNYYRVVQGESPSRLRWQSRDDS